ncbi:MAG: MaoC family dehydratase, partial [Actinomycetota bacterium]|nr:MaoC family dehydratase [Actinomycetota bacterium]
MSVDADLAGRTFPATAPYEVGREKIRDFLTAIGAEAGNGDEAPPTFAIVVAFRAMQQLLEDSEVGIALHRVVHA